MTRAQVPYPRSTHSHACGPRLSDNFTGERPACGLELTGPGVTVTPPVIE